MTPSNLCEPKHSQNNPAVQERVEQADSENQVPITPGDTGLLALHAPAHAKKGHHGHQGPKPDYPQLHQGQQGTPCCGRTAVSMLC